MDYKRLTITSVVLFIIALIWNGVVHLVILKDANSILSSVGRPESERSLVLSLVVTASLVVLFVWSYARVARRGTLAEGLSHGLFFGLLAGALADLNQYVLYPIPGWLALTWFGFGMLEFCLYGIITSKLYPVKTNTE